MEVGYQKLKIMNLIIVESPTKARTIQKFLGKAYNVMASFGHIRDLPKKELGIDIANNFKPKYVIPLLARKKVTPLKKAIKKADKVILATDEDREGESIAWHLAEVLGLEKPDAKSPKPKQLERIVFHEITKPAIEEALKNPRTIDMDLVDAQQARRILDRLVGYELSPFLWKKVYKGLSAGRVQSVALRLIVEREREIQNFKPEEYWSIEATFKKITDEILEDPASEKSNQSNNDFKPEPPSDASFSRLTNRVASLANRFTASLIKIDDKVIPRLGIKTKEEAEKILDELKNAQYWIEKIEKKEVKKNPLPPFTTSTLQQAAWQKLRFGAKLTMSLAQNLYENGYITYHRTDSLNVSDQALFAAKDFIVENFGRDYWAGFLRRFKTKSKGAQEAHEAIRPTNPQNSPETLKKELKYSKQFEDKLAKLYDLIWRRFIASQMSQAIFDVTTVDITTKNHPMPNAKQGAGRAANYTFRVNGQMLKFDGFLKVYLIKFKEADLPPLRQQEVLELIKLIPSQHFTQPPARYNDATIIKKLEELNIGRPSTYAPTLTTIQERNYVGRDETRRFKPNDIGFLVNDLLVEHFPEIVDYQFTARMEENLDKIAEGKINWVPVIKEFYEPFKKHLNQKYEEVAKHEPTAEQTDKVCPKCGAPLITKISRFGKFLACSKFPECRYVESINHKTGVLCPKCFEGEIVAKKTKRGKIFYACSRWPECDFALWHKPTGAKCPECGALLVENNKEKIICSNKECEHKENPALPKDHLAK